MKKILLFLVAGAVILGVATSRSDTDGVTARPGNPQVYADIATETDCAELQASFDRAEATHQRGGTWGPIGTAYMGAADDRMREVGCY